MAGLKFFSYFSKKEVDHHWKVLNLKPGSSDSAIKIGYYKMAQKYHPDKTGGQTTEKFNEIQKAYEVLIVQN